MSLLDLGAPGNSLGDVYHFSAALHSERGGPVTGELIGSKTLVKMPTDANPNLERRATLMKLLAVAISAAFTGIAGAWKPFSRTLTSSFTRKKSRA